MDGARDQIEPAPSAAIAAAREINGRRVNEAIERGHPPGARAIFLCECGNLGCNQRVELTIDQYEAVRCSFERFLIVPGHEIPWVEDVLERHPDYLVVAKRDDEAREMADKSDRRAP